MYEACDEVDSVTTFSLGRPTVTGNSVWFSTEAVRCESSRVELNRVRPAPYRRDEGRIPGSTLKYGITQVVVRDANRMYALIGREVTPDREAACPCALTSLEVPALKRSTAAPIRPLE